MFSADSVVAVVSLKRLLSRRVTIDTVLVENPTVNIEVSADGKDNWSLGEKGKKDGEESKIPYPIRRILKLDATDDGDGTPDFSIDIKSFRIRDASIRWRDLADNSYSEASIKDFRLDTEPGMPIEAEASVEYKGDLYKAALKGFLIDAEGKKTRDLLVSGRIGLGDAHADLVGKINDIADPSSMTGSLTLDIPSVRRTFENIASIGLEKPLSGTIDFIATNRFISIAHADLAYDTLNLYGDAEITLGRHPSIKGEFTAPTIDIPNLFFPGWEEAYLERVRTNTEAPDADEPYILDPKAFRNIPLPVETLGLANLNLKLHVGELKAMPEMPVRNIEIGAILNRGEAVVAPLKFDYMDGKVNISVLANNRENTFNGDVSIKATGVNAGKIVDSTGYPGVFKGGASNVDIVLKGSGRNLEEFMRTLAGYVKIYTTSPMEGYSIDKMLMSNDLLLSTLRFLATDVVGTVTGSKKTPKSNIQCIVANLDIHDGKTASNRGIAIQTGAANIVVDGEVDLGMEQMDVSIVTVVKEGLQISNSLAEMVKIQGAMARPRIIISTDGIINTAAKTAFTTVLLGTLTGGVTLITAGIGFLTKSWLLNIQEDRNPCLTAFEGKSEMRPNENFGDQAVIKEDLEGRVDAQKQELDGATTNRLNRAKERAKEKLN
jgi:hypothetical protein